MSTSKRPTFSELSRDDAVALLSRARVGRLAFSFHDHVDIEPISHVYSDGWIYARTSPGTKLNTLQHHPWVAFEVDEIRSRFDWQSAVARGTIYLLDPGRSPDDRAAYDLAVQLLRAADADALTESDATPHRQAVFRMHIDEITGRRATPGS